jgi:uncharacterized protein YlxW (UPF0749 family)
MRDDASLDALLADALASDYDGTASEDHGKLSVFFVVGATTLVTIVLGTALAETRVQALANLTTRTALVQRVQAADGRVATMEARVKTAQQNLQAAEQANLAGTSLGQQANLKLARLRAAAGFTALYGDGLEVFLSDAPVNGLVPSDAQQPGRIIDRDLQEVVNGLWQAGATGVAINGRRLTASSAIRSAGDAILVDYRPLLPPYKISAIGVDANQVAGKFRENQGGLLLEQLQAHYGIIWELRTLGKITLPAAGSGSTSGGTP